MPSPAFGLDISDRSVELISLVVRKGVPTVARHARTEIPAGVIDRGVIADREVFAGVITTFLDATFGEKRRTIRAGVSLPETVVFSKTFILPSALSKDDAASAMRERAQGELPMAFADAITDQWSVKGEGDSRLYFYAAVEKDVASAYDVGLRAAGVEPLFFDAESMALVRGLVPPRSERTLIVDIGARTTHVIATNGDDVTFSADIANAGDSFIAGIEVALNIPLAEAEKIKRSAGFDAAADEGRIFLVLQKPFGVILDDIRGVRDYVDRVDGNPVKTLLLAGGTSLTPKIAEYVEGNISGLTVVRGEPLKMVDAQDEPKEFKDDSLLYAVAIGLALRAAGIREGPALDLSPTGDHRQGGFISGIAHSAASLLTMVQKSKSPRAKKSSSKKAATQPKEETQIQPMQKAPVVPTAVPSASPVTVAGTGSGVGDILASSAAMPQQPALSEEGDHLSVEEVVTRVKATPVRKYKGGRANRALVLIGIVLFLAAGAGTVFLLNALGIIHAFPSKQTAVRKGAGSIVAAPETVSLSIVLAADPQTQAGGARELVLTRVIETDVSAEGTYPATGEAAAADAKSAGTVAITNSTSRAFTFVATTRLLSKEGVLFRLKSETTIPASGSVSAAVVADQKGSQGDIGPTTFSFPGLSVDLQTRVTAKSDAAMSGGSGKTASVSDADIAAAKAALSEKLKADALVNMAAMLAEGERIEPDLVASQEISSELPNAGDPGTTFHVALTLRFRALLVPEPSVQGLLDDKLAASGESIESRTGKVSYTVEAYDAVGQKAEVRAEAPITGN